MQAHNQSDTKTSFSMYGVSQRLSTDPAWPA